MIQFISVLNDLDMSSLKNGGLEAPIFSILSKIFYLEWGKSYYNTDVIYYWNKVIKVLCQH